MTYGFDLRPHRCTEPEDAAIIDALTSEPLSPQLVQRIAHWSAASCPAYQAELKECWSILSHLVVLRARLVILEIYSSFDSKNIKESTR